MLAFTPVLPKGRWGSFEPALSVGNDSAAVSANAWLPTAHAAVIDFKNSRRFMIVANGFITQWDQKR